MALLPAGTHGHVGPNLRRFVLMQYHQRQSPLPRLVALLQALGLALSKREVQHLLTAGQEGFPDAAREVLRAGLEPSSWVSADDISARHRGKNGVCTQIGNDRFTWFGTRSSMIHDATLSRKSSARAASHSTVRRVRHLLISTMKG